MACEVLDHREANVLAAALMAHSAARLGIRAMLIKGFSLEFHHLREDRVSADVDVLVEPGRAAELVTVLKAAEWCERAVPFGAARMTTHSVTLIREGWPNEFDVHGEYPGLSTPSAVAFDELWSRRVAVEIGGVGCWVPDRASSLVLWALHSLRGGSREPRHRLELAQLVNQVLPRLTPVERDGVASRMLALGADRALREVPELARLIGNRASPQHEETWVSWQRKVAQSQELTPWLQVFREAPYSEWPGLAWRACWPATRDLRLMDPDLVDTPSGRCRSRLARIGRFTQRWWATRVR